MKVKSQNAVKISLATALAFGLLAPNLDLFTQENNTIQAEAEVPTYEIMSDFRPQHEDFDKMPIVKEIEEQAGIKIVWKLIGDAAVNEQKNIAISTGDMPDAFLGMLNDQDIQKNPELFLPIEDTIENYPNVKKLLEEKPELKRYLTFDDGHIYSFPFVQEREYEGFYDNLFINQKWLDKLGLKTPTNIKEYEECLRAFKTQDPNGNGEADEIPLTMMIKHNYFGFHSLYGLFGQVDEPNHLILDKDNKVIFTATTDQWKNATKWLASLYKEGLIDTEGFSQDRSQLFAKGKAEPEIIGSTSAFLIDNVVGANRVADYKYLLLKGEGDSEPLVRFNSYPIQSRSNSVINAKVENPEGLLRFFDTCLDKEKNYSLQTVFGLIGKQLEEVKDSKDGYKFRFAVAPDGLSQDDYRYKDAPSHFPCYLDAEVWKSIEHAPDVARKEAMLEEARPYFTQPSFPPVIYTQEEVVELAQISSAIVDFVSQQQALWITGQADIDADWESYVSQLKDMNLDRYVEITQQAVSRYLG